MPGTNCRYTYSLRLVYACIVQIVGILQTVGIPTACTMHAYTSLILLFNYYARDTIHVTKIIQWQFPCQNNQA